MRSKAKALKLRLVKQDYSAKYCQDETGEFNNYAREADRVALECARGFGAMLPKEKRGTKRFFCKLTDCGSSEDGKRCYAIYARDGQGEHQTSFALTVGRKEAEGNPFVESISIFA